ncbi:hypothetical protein, partial [uncultured Kingella sp.]|uniref:hypothetical protein n=1 Tax=uncultured Kingella sp. TaxID=159270 RepID=UPI002599CA5E
MQLKPIQQKTVWHPHQTVLFSHHNRASLHRLPWGKQQFQAAPTSLYFASAGVSPPTTSRGKPLHP